MCVGEFSQVTTLHPDIFEREQSLRSDIAGLTGTLRRVESILGLERGTIDEWCAKQEADERSRKANGAGKVLVRGVDEQADNRGRVDYGGKRLHGNVQGQANDGLRGLELAQSPEPETEQAGPMTTELDYQKEAAR